MPFMQQWLEDLQGFFKAVHAMIEGQPERVILRLVPSRAYTQDQAPVAHLVNGRRHFRQDCWIAEGIARHQRTDHYPLCGFGQRRQHCPAFPDSSSRLTRIAIEEVVREPDTIEAIRLRLLSDCADRTIWALAVILAVVRQKDQQSNLHCLHARAFSFLSHELK